MVKMSISDELTTGRVSGLYPFIRSSYSLSASELTLTAVDFFNRFNVNRSVNIT